MLRCYFCSSPSPVPISSSYSYYVSDTIDNNGVLNSVVSLKPIDNADFFKNLKSSDFSIANLQSLGASSILTAQYRADSSKMSFVDQFQDLNLKSNENV